MTQPFLLDSRAIVSVTGDDAATFLHGLLTCGALDMATGDRRAGALLTPQGKISAETLLQRTNDGFLIDCDVLAAPVLVRKLSMFRLRAAVAVALRTDLGVTVFDGDPDPRALDAPNRRIAPASEASVGAPAAFHTARIAAGVAEQGSDYGMDEVFPADVNMDLSGGVDFRKGCYVGQEVVSRMKRRGTARRRTLQVAFDVAPPETPCPIIDESGAEIGILTSTAGLRGLARVRIDRLEAAGGRFRAGDATAIIMRPDWLADELAAMAAARETRT